MADRTSINLPGRGHRGGAIPMGSRIGNIVYSSGISGRVSGGENTDDLDKQAETMFKNMKAFMQLAGGTVRVESGPRVRDPGGRLLYYIYTMRGNSIDEILVREGLARAWTRDGQHRDALVRLERSARRSGSGCLW